MSMILLLLLGLGCEKKGPEVAEPLAMVVSAESLLFFQKNPDWVGTSVINEKTSLEFSVSFQVVNGSVSGSMSIPTQNAFDLPLDDIFFSDGELSFVLKPPKAPKFAWAHYSFPNAEKSLQEKEHLEGTLRQMKKAFPTTMSLGAMEELKRPQTPLGPFEYAQRELVIENPNDGAKLAGTLTYPKGEGKYPVAVLITGSGAQDRDETLFEHKPFLVIADHLTKNGVAVLRLDDRGIGGSTGVRDDLTSLTFAEDISVALDVLTGEPEIDASKMGLIGHSEGGLIASVIGSQRDDLAFIVSLAGTGVSGKDVLVQQNIDLFQEYEPTSEQVEQLGTLINQSYRSDLGEEEEAVVSDLLELQIAISGQEVSDEEKKQVIANFIVVKNSPWMKTFLSLDPAEYWVKVQAPVYALNGSLDVQVKSDVNLPAIEAALKSGGNENIKTEEFPSLNHLFQTAETGLIQEYVEIEETISPKVLDAMTSWIQEQVALEEK